MGRYHATMAYTVLARRYRSRSFDEVVGQESIARTLKAAIDQNKVAHAYLFSGTRGVGKTSMARIFADALNNPEGKEDIAQAIFTGQDTDTIEIDGASNRGVDEAREVIANSVYRRCAASTRSTSSTRSTCSRRRRSMPSSRPWRNPRAREVHPVHH